jgi:hypothetical protein
MKNKFWNYILLCAIVVSFSGCIENEDVVWTGDQVEFDAAIYNAPATGRTFPILTRVPGYGRPINTANTAAGTADPLITRTSGTINFFVNLVGAHKGASETLTVSVVNDPILDPVTQLPVETLATVNTHYTVPATITLDANSSVAQLPVTIVDPGATTGSVVLVLRLDGNSKITPSQNYKTIAIRIAQN